MADNWTSCPTIAWRKHIGPHTGALKWVEDGSHISSDIKISKRELLGMIIFASSLNPIFPTWHVGYSPSDPEPNDGYVSDGPNKFQLEHKLVAQMDKREIIDALNATYDKYAKKGPGYGAGRVLIVQANRQSQGLSKVSDFRDHIGDSSPFDAVLLLVGIKLNQKADHLGFHLHQFFPRPHYLNGGGIAQIEIEPQSGRILVPHAKISVPAKMS